MCGRPTKIPSLDLGYNYLNHDLVPVWRISLTDGSVRKGVPYPREPVLPAPHRQDRIPQLVRTAIMGSARRSGAFRALALAAALTCTLSACGPSESDGPDRKSTRLNS